MPPKGGFKNEIKLYFADGTPVGKITQVETLGDDIDINSGVTILQDDDFGFSCVLDPVQTLRKNGHTQITHRAIYSKKRRIRKKYEAICGKRLALIFELKAILSSTHSALEMLKEQVNEHE